MPEIPGLSWLIDRSNDWTENVAEDKLMGHGVRTAYNLMSLGGRAPILGSDPLSLLLKGVDPAEAGMANQKHLTGKAWVDQTYKFSPWQRALTGMVVDPMNLVGMGLPTKAIEGAAAGSKLYKALKVAEAADTLPGKVTAPVFDLAGKGAGKAVGGVAGFLKPHADDFARVHPNVSAGIDNVMRGWREQALLSPGYHVRNATENVLRPALEGDFTSAKEGLKGLATGRNRFDDVASKYGFDKDIDIQKAINQDPTGTAGTGSVYRKVDFAPKPKPSAPTRIPSPGSSVPDGTLANHLHTDGMGKHHQAVVINGDAVQLNDVAEFNTGTWNGVSPGPMKAKITDIYEDGNGVVRMVVDPGRGKTYTVDPLSVNSQNRIITHTPGPGWSSGTTTAAPNIAQKTGNFAAGKVADAMDLNRRFGTHVERQARKGAVVSEYERAIAQGATHDQAVKGATDYADKLFFNYSDTGPVDELGRNLFAFHKFGMHNLPAQMRAAGAKPAMLNVPSQYYRSSDEYNAQHGLPSRFHGEMPILGDSGWHVNPLGLWSMGQLVGAGSKRTANDDEGTPLGETGDLAQGLGLGLNPFIDAMLTVTGQHGRSFAPSFLRASQPVNGILSSLMDRPVDIEGGPKELLGNLQEQITGQRPFPYQEYLLNKRQAELKAFKGDPTKAGQQVGDQMAAEGLAGFAGIPGLKLLTPEERDIRRNSALAKAYKLAGNQAGYKANPTARTYADLDPRDAQVANWENLSAAERRRLLRDPEVRDQLLDKLAFQLHNSRPTVPRSVNPFATRGRELNSRSAR